MIRDLVGYGQTPPQVRWPDGSRLALNFVINYEEGSELTPANGDAGRERMSEAMYATEPGDRELIQESVYEYGSRVGVWRVIRQLEEHGVTATVYASAVALERNEQVTRSLVDHRFDFVGHGYRWWPHYGMSVDEERASIAQALDSIEASTGQRPIGWFTRPLPSINTRRLLVEAGLAFDSDSLADDVPYYTPVDGRPHLVVPYTLDVNDIRFWKNSLFTADDWFEYARDSFETLYEESRGVTRMMSIGLHPRVIGRPGRIGALGRFLDYVRQYDDVWICNRSELARYWLATVPAVA